MPHRFFAIEGHQISVNGLPHGATLLASSASCPSQALRFGKNIYTTQFHSELDDADLEYRMQLFPNYRKIAGDSRPNAPAPHSVTPLRNFLKWEAGQLDSLATSVTIAA
jgi:GMP synthase-like glutamine amidotransferase